MWRYMRLCRRGARRGADMVAGRSRPSPRSMSLRGALSKQAARRAHPRQAPAGPGPLEVVAADPSVDVEDLPAQEQARAPPRGHGRHVDLVERDAARRDLREEISAVADNR